MRETDAKLYNTSEAGDAQPAIESAASESGARKQEGYECETCGEGGQGLRRFAFQAAIKRN